MAHEPVDGVPDDGSAATLRAGSVDPLERRTLLSPARRTDDRRRVAEELVTELAVSAAGIGTYDWDLVTGRLEWDARMLALFGLEPDDFGATIEAFYAQVDPEQRAMVEAAIGRAMALGSEYDLEYRIVLPDGTSRWVAARGRALCDEAGATVRVLGAAYDCTAREDTRALAARVLEDMPTAFFALDRSWRFTYVNSQAERLLRSTQEEMLGADLWTLFPAAVGSEFERAYRQAMGDRVLVRFEALYPAPFDRWFDVSAWPRDDGLAVYFHDVTEHRRAQEVAEAAVARSELRARVSAAFSAGLEPEEAVAALAQLLTPSMADWCVITVTDDDPDGGGRRGFRDVGVSHRDPALRPLVERYAELRLTVLRDPSYLGRALEQGETLVIPQDGTAAVASVLHPGEARTLLEQLAPESAAVFPMRARGRTVGAITIFRGADRPAPSPEDVTQLDDLAARAALGLDNARLYRQQRRLAEGLQRALLTEPPASEHMEVVTRYEPAAELAKVGGDWYDAFVQPDAGTVLVIGDVVGHDVTAAATMGQVRSVLRGIAVTTGDGPARVIERTDRALRALGMDAFATVVVARVEQTAAERADGVCRVRWSNAGHPDPLVVEVDGSVRHLTGGRHDVLLGVRPDVERTEWEVEIRGGATLLLYTDGLVERRGEDLRLGLQALERTVAELTAAGLDLPTLCDEVLRRGRPPERRDDVALVAVRLHPQDRT